MMQNRNIYGEGRLQGFPEKIEQKMMQTLLYSTNKDFAVHKEENSNGHFLEGQQEKWKSVSNEAFARPS